MAVAMAIRRNRKQVIGINMSDKRIQLRGNCQCCGRDQAVKSGRMSKHGYTVENGWFQGVCGGHSYAPMQHERDTAEKVIASVRAEVIKLQESISNLKTGKAHPSQAKSAPWYGAPMVAFKDAPEHEQQKAVEAAVNQTEGRVRQGTMFAGYMENLLNEVHGKKLIEVEIPSAPELIGIGEVRKNTNGSFLTVYRIQGARVHWKNERGFKGWTGSGAWRKLEIITAP